MLNCCFWLAPATAAAAAAAAEVASRAAISARVNGLRWGGAAAAFGYSVWPLGLAVSARIALRKLPDLRRRRACLIAFDLALIANTKIASSTAASC